MLCSFPVQIHHMQKKRINGNNEPFWRRYARVTGSAFAGVVPARQLLVEEAAEDVRALGHGGGGVQVQVPGSQKHIWTPAGVKSGSLSRRSKKKKKRNTLLRRLLEVKVNDDVV